MQTTAPQLRELAQRALLRMDVLIDHANALEANAPISGRFKVADVPFIRARAARLQKGYRRLIEAAAVRDRQGSVAALFAVAIFAPPALAAGVVLGALRTGSRSAGFTRPAQAQKNHDFAGMKTANR